MPADLRANALDDLLDAERHFRGQAEQALRDLRSVLIELAQRMAGSLIEDARRADPNAPDNWGSEQWRKFFASLPGRASGNVWNEDLPGELIRLKTENQSLKAKLADLPSPSWQATEDQAPVPGIEKPPVDATPMPFKPTTSPQPAGDQQLLRIDPPGCMHAHLDFLRELRSLKLPTTLPVRFESHFHTSRISGTDRERNVRRKLYVLYLASRGLDIRLEIDHLISQVEGISSRTGGLRRIYDSLVESNLLSREILEMSAPTTSLATLLLSEDGRQLCQTLGWEVRESEHQRINRLHMGALFPQHTLGILIFAMHARLRGYRVSVLPKMEGVQTHAIPDVCVTRGLTEESPERIYAEVELSNKEMDVKWQNLATLQGLVALCARTTLRRTLLVGDCKLKNLHGMATDLETLIACKVPEISEDTPLWAEAW